MNSKLKAALKMSALSPDEKVTKATAIITAMQANTVYFPTTTVPMPYAALTTAVNNLHNAIIATGSGAQGTISNMHEKERLLISMFNVIRSYVEYQANNSTDPKTVIESAGMVAVTINGGIPVTELTLTAIGNGSVQVSVPRNTGEAAFVYQYSSDGGTTWVEFECSKLATVTLMAQTPASVLHFRFAPIAKTKGAFSQSKSVIVL